MILNLNMWRQVPPHKDGRSDVKVEETSSATDLVEDFFENDILGFNRIFEDSVISLSTLSI